MLGFGPLSSAPISGYANKASSGAAPGSYATTGYGCGFRYIRYKLVAEPGAYALTGLPARLRYSGHITVKAAYQTTWLPVSLRFNRRLSAIPGAMVLTPSSKTTMLHHKRLPVAPGSYSLSGYAATLRYLQVGKASPGTYSHHGFDAGKRMNRVLEALPGSYLTTGFPAGGGFGEYMTPEDDWFVALTADRSAAVLTAD